MLKNINLKTHLDFFKTKKNKSKFKRLKIDEDKEKGIKDDIIYNQKIEQELEAKVRQSNIIQEFIG